MNLFLYLTRKAQKMRLIPFRPHDLCKRVLGPDFLKLLKYFNLGSLINHNFLIEICDLLYKTISEHSL